MRLTIKTLQQITFKVDIEPEQTVKELKDKIENEQGKEYQVAFQKLIYSGKILADETKLSEYEIDEKKFIVLMMTRPPPAPKPAEPAKSVAKPAVKQEEPKSVNKTKTSTEDKNAQARPATRSSTSGPASTPVVPSNTNTTSTTNLAPSTGPTATTTSTTPATGVPRQPPRASLPMDGLNQSQMMQRLASFMNQPEFRQMQDLIQQSPHLLSSTIEALAISNPEIYNLITENPDVFVAALNHPPTGSMQTHSGASRGGMGGIGGASSELLAGPGPAIEQILPGVSEHDKEAIERLKELGFSEYLAVQAYMACDKDEQLAANLLFQMEQ